jgi:hypothetical protein
VVDEDDRIQKPLGQTYLSHCERIFF